MTDHSGKEDSDHSDEDGLSDVNMVENKVCLPSSSFDCLWWMWEKVPTWVDGHQNGTPGSPKIFPLDNESECNKSTPPLKSQRKLLQEAEVCLCSFYSTFHISDVPYRYQNFHTCPCGLPKPIKLCFMFQMYGWHILILLLSKGSPFHCYSKPQRSKWSFKRAYTLFSKKFHLRTPFLRMMHGPISWFAWSRMLQEILASKMWSHICTIVLNMQGHFLLWHVALNSLVWNLLIFVSLNDQISLEHHHIKSEIERLIQPTYNLSPGNHQHSSDLLDKFRYIYPSDVMNVSFILPSDSPI